MSDTPLTDAAIERGECGPDFARELERRLARPEGSNTKDAFAAGVKWGREMYPEVRNEVIEECALVCDRYTYYRCASELRALKQDREPQAQS